LILEDRYENLWTSIPSPGLAIYAFYEALSLRLTHACNNKSMCSTAHMSWWFVCFFSAWWTRSCHQKNDKEL